MLELVAQIILLPMKGLSFSTLECTYQLTLSLLENSLLSGYR